MFKKILVPLDGSDLAERALESAFALGRAEGGEVLLLRVPCPEKMLVPDAHIYGGFSLIWPDQSLERCRGEAEDYLKAIQTSKAPPHLAVRTKVVENGVAETIVDMAAAEKMDLIVMSSHGYSGITRWMLGSVAEKVLRSAPCPVLMLRSSEPLRRVLIPLDGSELAELALAPGLAVAATLGAEVTLLRAVPRVALSDVEQLNQTEQGLGRRLEDGLHDEAENYLSRLSALHRRPGAEIKTAVMTEPAAYSILKYAETHAIDLIVMSTHGRTGLKRWVYGSVTEKVLRGADRSMLVIRPAAHKLIG